MKVTQVKSAKKPRKCGKCGTDIAVGSPYIWWAFRYGGKRSRCTLSACYPRPSELINSPFLSRAAELGEGLEDAVAEYETSNDLGSLLGAVEETASGFRELGEEAQESFDNMPEGLQQGDTGQMLEERVSKCEEIADELDALDLQSTYDEAVVELPEVDPDEDWEDSELEALAEKLDVEKEEDEDRPDFVQRLAGVVEERREEARTAVIEELQGISLEVE
ncbi:MAG: hypothetical protein ABL984_00545 [Pyrinomonadaceae bacterium]